MGLIWLLIIFIATLWLLEQEQPGPVLLAGCAGLLLLGSAALPILLTRPLWVLLALFSVITLAGGLRRDLLLKPLLPMLRRQIPTLSDTEREALEAGSVWWDGELFSGRPDWHKLLAQPAPQLSEAEQAFIDGPLEELIERVDEWQIYQRRDLTQATWNLLKKLGLFGMVIPKEYGGLGFSAYGHSCVIMKLASHSVTTAVTAMVPNSLGPAELLLNYGSDEQKNHWLPKLASGEEIPCFALTGPIAGSDAGSIPDVGVVCMAEYEGQQQLGIRLNFSKRYITLAPVATVIGLAFKMQDPDQLLGDQPDLGITVALIPAATAGVDQGQRHNPLGLAFQNGPLYGKDVFVPLSAIIGGEAGIGNGWRMVVECLAEGRGISLPALATGSGKIACRFTGAYARVREQFQTPIGLFEGVAEPLGRIAGLTYMMDAARQLTCTALAQGEQPAVVTAILKYHLTETMRSTINDAMDIQGGSGIMLGPRNLIGPVYQAVPVAITVEGANILTRNLIIFGQGAIRAHPWLLQEMTALADSESNPQAALDSLDAALTGHIGYGIRNLARSLRLGFSQGHFSETPNHPMRRQLQQMNWLSAAFTLCADLALLLFGGQLKRRENISARFGDCLSQLYLASAVVKRFSDQGRRQDDLPLAQWACANALHQGEQALMAAIANFPQGFIAKILKLWIRPLGTVCPPPSDELQRAIAGILLKPSASRDRLTDGIFLNSDESHQRGRLDAALELSKPVAELKRQLRRWIKTGELQPQPEQQLWQTAVDLKLLNADQRQQLLRYQSLQLKIIQVDAFDGRQVANP